MITMSEKKLPDKIGRIIISEEQIREKVRETGEFISREYAGKPLLIVGILNGCVVFLSDLIRQISIPCEIGFISASSYCGTKSTGCVEINLDLKQDISGYNVIIAEDVIDTGVTLAEITDMLRKRNPLSLKVVAFADKPSGRKVDFKPDYTLFTVPDLFIVGYGLDCDGLYRGLPYIAEYGG